MPQLRRFSPRHFFFLLVLGAGLVGSVSWGIADEQGGLELDWFSIDGGATTSRGGSFELTATPGQPDAGRLAGGSFEFVGGFWAIPNRPACESSAVVFCDNFESGDLSSWSLSVP